MKANHSGVSELEKHIGFWLRYVSNHVSHRFALKLADSSVTVAEWVILREMFDFEVTSPGNLAKVTGLTKGAVSKLIDRLLDKRLVTRAEAAEDRRFQDVSLTAAGRALVPRLAKLADENDEEFFSHLSRGERKRLMSTLKQLAQTHHLGTLPTK